MTVQKLLLTPEDVERMYGIPRSTQAKNRMAGRFAPYVKHGRNVYVTRADMDAWLSTLKRKSTIVARDGG